MPSDKPLTYAELAELRRLYNNHLLQTAWIEALPSGSRTIHPGPGADYLNGLTTCGERLLRECEEARALLRSALMRMQPSEHEGWENCGDTGCRVHAFLHARGEARDAE